MNGTVKIVSAADHDPGCLSLKMNRSEWMRMYLDWSLTFEIQLLEVLDINYQ